MYNFQNQEGYYFSNSPYIERKYTYLPTRVQHTNYVQNPNFIQFQSTNNEQYQIIQEDYLNIPLDEFYIVQNLTLKTKTKDPEKGEQIKQLNSPTVVLTQRSSNGFIPFQTVWPEVSVRDNNQISHPVRFQGSFWMQNR